MSSAHVLLGVALATLTPAAAAYAQQVHEHPPPPAVAVEQLKELETRWGQAFVNHDSLTLGRMIAEEYEGIYPTRRLTRRDMLASAVLRPPPGARRLIDSQPDDTKQVRIFGDVAVVTGSAVQRFEEGGRVSVMRTVYTEVFVWRDGRWQAVAGHYTPLMTPN